MLILFLITVHLNARIKKNRILDAVISGGKCARYAEEIPHGPIRKFGNLNLYDLTI